MSRGLLIALVVVVVLVGGIVAWAISVNNQLVVLEQGVNEKWARCRTSTSGAPTSFRTSSRP